MMKKWMLPMVMALCAVFLSGCATDVPQGHVGRVKTRSGWTNEILPTGRHTCFGFDTMYLMDITNVTFKEHLNILVGGKVNLKVDYSVRVKANTEDANMVREAFENIVADATYKITVEQLYMTYLQMKAQAIPRQVYEVQPDISTAIANSPQLAMEVRKAMTEAARSTPLVVEDAEITNYDWPESITKAQEELATVQLSEAAAEAKVRAELKRVEGQLKVEEANKLVELKKAEAISESIDIIKSKLAGSPEYLMWHQIRVMGQAAMGPNNCFILYPFATAPNQIKQMVSNANLTQLLHPEGPHPELKAGVKQDSSATPPLDLLQSDLPKQPVETPAEQENPAPPAVPQP